MGFVNSFGVSQTYYVTTLDRPPSDISWVGSIQVFLLFIVGTISGRLTDAGFFRPGFFAGSVLSLLGLFMTSLTTSYTQLFLAQGVCISIGNGFMFTPTMSMLSTYFSTKRSLAIGLASAGSSTGAIVFPLMVQQLLPKVGFAWTIRALGLIQFICLGAANLGLRSPTRPRKNWVFVDRASFTDWPYVLFAMGMFFVSSFSPSFPPLRLKARHD
ncbi:hypothetical protein HYFRA_00013552 [Hymenoscyphus fraxineus]|uniref:Major facilitator superfamily (MFS) profile domain-containing protein n=1 Tax=Hymenoscyphus fraxineus TaxID=746836 RepID=A0A9N9LB48_9HELO|nr:hypothetical protein HYFRA_00013552 [Hymenoscyphus fraxineus]